MSARLEAMGVGLYAGAATRSGESAKWTGEIRADEALLWQHMRALRPGRVTFVGSMTDLFHEQAEPWAWRDLADAAREVSSRPADKRPRGMVTLTKRADRLLAFQRQHFPDGLPSWWWAGVTVADQTGADLRLPALMALRAGGPKVVSYEPAMGPVDWDPLWCHYCNRPDHVVFEPPAQPWCVECDAEAGSPGWFDPDGIGWLIAGGESGPKARPSHPDWFRAARDAAGEAGVPFFFKQWGEWAPDDNRANAAGHDPWPHVHMCHDGAITRGMSSHGDAPVRLRRFGKSAAGRLLDGREWSEVPHA
jgi:protein gp37